MSAAVAGTFASGSSAGAGMRSDVLVINFGVISMGLTLSGDIDASNTVRAQKSIDNGITWADQVLYNSAQAGVAVTVVHGEQWSLLTVAAQPLKSINYKMSMEN